MKLNIQLFADGEVVIETRLDTTGVEKGMDKVKNLVRKPFNSDYDVLEDEATGYFELVERKQDDVNAKIEETKAKVEEVKESIDSNGLKIDNLVSKTTRIKDGIDGVIKKVAKWGLAIFSVRSAYSFVRQSISTISQYNKTLANDLENIRFGLASALQPLIQKIVEWAYRLMQAVNYIWRILTGKNLFTNIKKDLKASNKSAKELQKTVAGFDEMNILGKSSTGGGGGIGDAGLSQDLTDTNLLTDEQKARLEKIAEILGTVWGWLTKIGNWFKDRMGLIYGAIAGIMGLKIGTKIGSIVTLLGGNGAKGGLIGALVALDGVLVYNIAITLKEKLIPLIKDVNKRLEKTIELTKGQDKVTSKTNKAILDYAKSTGEANEKTSGHINTKLREISTNERLNHNYQEQISFLGSITGENKIYYESIKANNEQNYENLMLLGELYDMGMLDAEQTRQYTTLLEREIRTMEQNNANLVKGSEEYQKNADKVKLLKDQLGALPSRTTTTVTVDANTKPARNALSSFLSDVQSAGALGGMLGLKNISSAINKIKYAKGGVVNLPSRGVPIAGESGPEGIVPLTDSQQMELLGQAIGKYINFNATIPVYVGNRQVAREIRKIEQEEAFAGNR